MMASGRPVIATASQHSQISKVLDGCGLTVSPGNLDGFCSAIEELANDENKATALGRAGREYVVEKWSREKILGSMFGGLAR